MSIKLPYDEAAKEKDFGSVTTTTRSMSEVRAVSCAEHDHQQSLHNNPNGGVVVGGTGLGGST